MFCKIGVLRNLVVFTGKHLHWSLFFKKETSTQVFSCEYCKIFQNSFFYRTLLVAGSNYFFAMVFIKFDRDLKNGTARSNHLWLFKCSKTKLKKIIFLRKRYVWFLENLVCFLKSYLFKINICIPFQKI